MLRISVVVMLMGVAANAWAAQPMFTVQGDAASPLVDTVQVDTDSLAVFDALRTVRLRVNRAAPRTGYDGGLYRSYVATTQIHCAGRAARFVKLELYAGPLWTGASRKIDYGGRNMPPMVFKDMAPNPTGRILNAACTLQAVKSNPGRPI